MARQSEFEAFICEHLSALGTVTTRRMFGGAGVYAAGVMFGLIADERLYLKTDPALRDALDGEGSEPFVWTRPTDGKLFDMGYLSLPETAMDDPDEAADWGRRALSVALAAKAAKPPPKPRKKTASKP
jgi:DNA transformation protein and related proteins